MDIYDRPAHNYYPKKKVHTKINSTCILRSHTRKPHVASPKATTAMKTLRMSHLCSYLQRSLWSVRPLPLPGHLRRSLDIGRTHEKGSASSFDECHRPQLGSHRPGRRGSATRHAKAREAQKRVSEVLFKFNPSRTFFFPWL
jgi:hypothetical protein